MTDKPTQSVRVQMLLIALTFIVPMALAAWLYYGADGLRPSGRTNHGFLLQPVTSLADELGEDHELLRVASDRWALVYVQDGPCDSDCERQLYTQRQVRLMLGNDMNRLQRVLLHGTEAPDNLFLAEEHAGLAVLQDRPARQLLEYARPDDAGPDGFYLVDPLGNLVMYFPADIAPSKLVEDLEHLLKISRIG